MKLMVVGLLLCALLPLFLVCQPTLQTWSNLKFFANPTSFVVFLFLLLEFYQ